MIYEGTNQPILNHVPKKVKRLLDVGCGSGSLGRAIKEEIACQVVGVTFSEAEARLAAQHLDEVLVCDLNNVDSLEAGQFDCIICRHVLEHLYHPRKLLIWLRRSLAPNGVVIVALPNVLHWRQRIEFLRGHFKYTEGGLIDQTHYRFFDWVTARELLTGSGYTILESEACGAFPLSRFLLRAATKSFPGLFGFQFVFICIPDSLAR
jgi:2-polyprenyl-3-methyl-5-hydroxy-6-metoxy-1,4-benzoquinol methylase